MKNLKRSTFALSILIALLVAGCGDMSPEQGAGELWLYERGEARCVNVNWIRFIASRWTKYETESGAQYSTGAPLNYYAGSKCN